MRIADRFVLVTRIGKGSMGQVWLARHATLGSLVAIKFLRTRAARDPWIRRRFLDEARILARLETRHAVKVFDSGITKEGLAFVAMEYLDGETLAARLRREGTLTPAATARLLGQAARGLGRAHSLGVVHRDFKPDNIVLAVDDEGNTVAKVIDFGIAKIGDTLARERTTATLPDEESSDRAPGTPSYMAPEQAGACGDVGPSSDQWAFGVVAYLCLTGTLPFGERRTAELFRAIRAGRYAPPSTRNAALSPAVDAWARIVFSVDPARRYPNLLVCADSLAAALDVSAAAASPWRERLEASSPAIVVDRARRAPLASLASPWPARARVLAIAAASAIASAVLVTQIRPAVMPRTAGEDDRARSVVATSPQCPPAAAAEAARARAAASSTELAPVASAQETRTVEHAPARTTYRGSPY